MTFIHEYQENVISMFITKFNSITCDCMHKRIHVPFPTDTRIRRQTDEDFPNPSELPCFLCQLLILMIVSLNSVAVNVALEDDD